MKILIHKGLHDAHSKYFAVKICVYLDDNVSSLIKLTTIPGELEGKARTS